MHKEFRSAMMLFEYAAAQGIPVNLQRGKHDLLKLAIDLRSHERVVFILDRVANKCTTVEETARIMKGSFLDLLKQFSFVLQDVLKKNTFCFEHSRFMMPLRLVDKPKAEPVTTDSNHCFTWEAEDKHAAKAIWTGIGIGKIADQSDVNVTAVSIFVCIANALQVGMKGILRPLLLGNAPVEVFKSDIVKWVVEWKWQRFWRMRFLRSFMLYLLLLLCFSTSALVAGKVVRDRLSRTDLSILSATFFVSVVLSLLKIIPECRQVLRHMNEGPSARWYYFRSPWNWTKLFSYIMMLLIIPDRKSVV